MKPFRSPRKRSRTLSNNNSKQTTNNYTADLRSQARRVLINDCHGWLSQTIWISIQRHFTILYTKI